MSLAGSEVTDPDIITHDLCKMFHCLPSQLQREDYKMIEKFIIIENEYQRQADSEQRRQISESMLRSSS